MKTILIYMTLATFAIYADNSIEIDSTTVTIKGNGEDCKVSMSSTGAVLNTDCIQLTNSKKIKILCTKTKKICKTVDEVKLTLSSSKNKTYKTSYNCDKAQSQTEKDICHSEAVSAIDYKLGNTYMQMKTVMPNSDFKALQTIQKEWVVKREVKCGKLTTFKQRESCLLAMYKLRLDSFSLMSVRNSQLSQNKSFEEVYKNGTAAERFDLVGYYYFDKNDIPKATKLLRKIIGDNKEGVYDAYSLLFEMHDEYTKTFDSEIQELVKTNHNSIGRALQKISKDLKKIQDVFLKEAYFLNGPAEILIEYHYKSDGYDKSYKDKIFSFYSECADDGIPRCKYFMGEVYMYGYGVNKNIKKGLSLLENANIEDAYYLLGRYYYSEEDITKAKKNFKLAAEMQHMQSMFALGIIFQEEKNYTKSIEYFKTAIKEDSTYYAAIYELGRMYIEGWGVEKDYLKAIDILNPVIENSKDESLVEVTHKAINIAKFYLGNSTKGTEGN